MSDETQFFPAIGSHWRDSTGADGTFEVIDHHKGYVVAAGPDLPNGEAIIQPGHFGQRYQPEPVRVIKGVDFKGTDARGNPLFVVTDAEYQDAPGAAGADRGADLDPQPSDTIRHRVGGSGA